jgi:hypothetical protein
MKAWFALVTMGDMPEQSSRRGGRTVPYRIVVRGGIGSSFVGPLEGMTVESVAAESSLLIDVVDQSHLQSVLQALSARGVEIVRLDVASGEEPAPSRSSPDPGRRDA